MKRTFVRLALHVVIWVVVASIQSPVLAKDATPTEDFMDMDLEELLNVEVSVASKKPESTLEAPGVVVVVSKEEFDLYGDRNLHQLLQRQPSIYTRDVFPYTDNVAGFRGDMCAVYDMHTLILLNGRPIRESAQGLNVNMYQTFPLSTLESVELIRGPGSVLYGSNAFTGVVNLKTRAIPDQNEISVSGMGGSYGYYETDVTAAGRSGELGYVTAVRVAGQQGYPYNMTDALGVYGEDHKRYKSYSAVAHLNYGNFTFDSFWSDYDAFAIGVLPFWSNPHKSFLNKKLFLNAGYRVPMHDRMTLELNATYNLQENGLTSYKPQIIGTNTSDFLGEVTLFANPLDNLNFVLGYLQEYRSNYAPDSDRSQSIPPYDYSPQSAYAQGDYKIDDSIKLIAGTQWNESSQGYSDFVNRFGVIITPLKKWGVKLLRGEAFRAPVTIETDIYDPPTLVGNSNIEPETITTYDAQLFYHDKKTYAAVTYFNSAIDKLITFDYSVVPATGINSGKQRFHGIEFEAKRSLTPNWQILGSFMHQENEGDAGVNPTVVPENMLKVGTDYTWDWGSASIFYSYFGTPTRIASPLMVNPTPEALNLVSFNLRIDPSKWLGTNKGRSILTLRVENLCNEKIYVPTFAYIGVPNSFPYGPGRTFYIGLELHN